MDRSNTCELLAVTKAKDEYGVIRETVTARTVYCAVQSVTRAEFFDAGRSGLNPEYRLTMFAWDYQGEPMLRYSGKTYSIYRTYVSKTDEIELYVERKGGTNGKGESV